MSTKLPNTKPYAVIICGPTASGKTDLSYKIANEINCEIVNADLGQFYTHLSIGTAKPDWSNNKIQHHLFDILNYPKNFTAFEFKELVISKVKDVINRGNLPIIVGGSLFYIKSLLFPPINLKRLNIDEKKIDEDSETNLWHLLNSIDPIRAKSLHPNDTYRIKRALDIWQTTGILPSMCEPKFNPPFNFLLIYIDIDKNILIQKINRRAELMLNDENSSPWINEVIPLISTDWEKFINEKKFIGYPEVIHWIKNHNYSFEELKNKIQKSTLDYAKKQNTFWKSFSSNLTKNRNNSPFHYDVFTLDDTTLTTTEKLINLIKTKL